MIDRVTLGRPANPITALFRPPTFTKSVNGRKRIGPYPHATVGEGDTTVTRKRAEKLP